MKIKESTLIDLKPGTMCRISRTMCRTLEVILNMMIDIE